MSSTKTVPPGDRSVAHAEAQAATYELVTELREALLDRRDPNEVGTKPTGRFTAIIGIV